MSRKYRNLRALTAALVIIMLALLSACGVPGISPIASPVPSVAAGVPAVSPAASGVGSEPSPAAAPASTTLLWPEPLPDGLHVDVAHSSVDAGGWTLELFDPGDPQNIVWIRGGAGLSASPRPGSRTVTVRGVEGNAFTTGAGWGITWVEGEVYNEAGYDEVAVGK